VAVGTSCGAGGTPHLRSKRLIYGGKPCISRIERENEAARDRADAQAQAMKTV